ncbi:MAG: GNAT family N-acetyltransferase [Chloroflexi bacterium]|nr:GNAT family N-acetyltransferase [Chloroflexota bacterium]
MPYQIVAASDVNFDAYVQAFNEAYAHYFVHIQLTPANLMSLIKRDAIDLTSSVATLDETGRVVGMAMLAIRPPRSWVGGVGVVEDHRQRGLARKMMVTLIENARQKGLAGVELEVITQNTKAYNLYCDLGFEIQRRLLIMERPAGDATIPEGYLVRECSPLEALAYFDKFHDTPNAWQRSLPALQSFAINNLEGWAIARRETPAHVVGYAVGWPNENHIQWMDIAIDPQANQRSEIGIALLASLHHELPTATGGIVNLGEHDVAVTSFEALGYTEAMAQYEMRLKF